MNTPTVVALVMAGLALAAAITLIFLWAFVTSPESDDRLDALDGRVTDVETKVDEVEVDTVLNTNNLDKVRGGSQAYKVLHLQANVANPTKTFDSGGGQISIDSTNTSVSIAIVLKHGDKKFAAVVHEDLLAHEQPTTRTVEYKANTSDDCMYARLGYDGNESSLSSECKTTRKVDGTDAEGLDHMPWLLLDDDSHALDLIRGRFQNMRNGIMPFDMSDVLKTIEMEAYTIQDMNALTNNIPDKGPNAETLTLTDCTLTLVDLNDTSRDYAFPAPAS